nr:MAG: polyprotein [Totiviridae sp.]
MDSNPCCRVQCDNWHKVVRTGTMDPRTHGGPVAAHPSKDLYATRGPNREGQITCYATASNNGTNPGDNIYPLLGFHGEEEGEKPTYPVSSAPDEDSGDVHPNPGPDIVSTHVERKYSKCVYYMRNGVIVGKYAIGVAAIGLVAYGAYHIWEMYKMGQALVDGMEKDVVNGAEAIRNGVLSGVHAVANGVDAIGTPIIDGTYGFFKRWFSSTVETGDIDENIQVGRLMIHYLKEHNCTANELSYGGAIRDTVYDCSTGKYTLGKLSDWARDLLKDGDVEANPGPSTIATTAFNGVGWSTPVTIGKTYTVEIEIGRASNPVSNLVTLTGAGTMQDLYWNDGKVGNEYFPTRKVRLEVVATGALLTIMPSGTNTYAHFSITEGLVDTRAVRIDPSSLPIWISEHGTQWTRDLTRDGDVEKNPGPTIFAGHKDILSNLNRSRDMEYDGNKFMCIEQLYMYRKAVACRDSDRAEQLLRVKDGYEAKKIGSEIVVDDAWLELRDAVMKDCIMARLAVDPRYRDALAQAEDRILEGTPNQYWGIGCTKTQYLARCEEDDSYSGKNMLGMLLLCVKMEQNLVRRGPSHEELIKTVASLSAGDSDMVFSSDEDPISKRKLVPSTPVFSERLLIDHLTAMSRSRHNNWSDLIALQLGIETPTSNRFAILAGLEAEFELDYPDLCSTPNADGQQSGGKQKKMARSRDDVEARPKQGSAPKAGQRQVDTRSPEEKLNSVVRRITASFEKDNAKFIAYLKKKPKRAFVKRLAEELWGETWVASLDMNQYQWVVLCYLEGVSDWVCMVDIFHTDNMIRTWYLRNDAGWDEYVREKSGNTWSETVAVRKTEQILHNRIMHAYNGNPVFPRTMSEVDTLPRWETMYTSADAGPEYDPLATEAMFTYLPSASGALVTDLRRQDAICADITTATNAIIQQVTVKLPNTPLIPRQVRPAAGGNLIPAAIRLSTQSVAILPYAAEPLEMTAVGRSLRDAVAQQQTQSWRRDNNLSTGFLMYDIIGLNSSIALRGLSMEQCVLKLDLLHSVLAHGVQQYYIPDSIYSAIDNHTIAADIPPTVDANNSVIFGEGCGVDAGVFPFGGTSGVLSFHQTPASIPAARVPYAIYCPPGLLLGQNDPALALAYFVAMWTEWPFCMPTVTKYTNDINGANQAAQLYIPFQGTVRVPGRNTLDIILAKDTAVGPPMNQAMANDNISVQPMTGYRTTVAYQAVNMLLNVSFMNGVSEYNLTEYLLSWFPQADAPANNQYQFNIYSLQTFVTSLQMLTRLDEVFPPMHDVALSLTSRFPAMIESVAANTTDVVVGSQAMFQTSSSACHNAQLTTANWPIVSPRRHDRQIFETDYMAWNQVALGLRTSASNQGYLGDAPAWIGNTRCVYWEVLQALTQAAVWNVHYANCGLPVTAWNTLLSNTESKALQDLGEMMYVGRSVAGSIAPARTGEALTRAYCAMIGRRTPGYTPDKKNEKRLTTFHRYMVQQDFAGFWRAGAFVSGMTPCNIPDVFINLLVDEQPRWTAPYPPCGGLDSTAGYTEGLVPYRNADNTMIAGFIDDYKPVGSLMINQVPRSSDNSLWNTRIIWQSSGRIVADYAGEALPAADFVGVDRYIRPRPMPIPAGTVRPTDSLGANTICIPQVTSAGLRVYAFVTYAFALNIVNAQQRRTRITRPAWIIDGARGHSQLTFMTAAEENIWAEMARKNFPMKVDAAVALDSAVAPVPPEMTSQLIPNVLGSD